MLIILGLGQPNVSDALSLYHSTTNHTGNSVRAKVRGFEDG